MIRAMVFKLYFELGRVRGCAWLCVAVRGCAWLCVAVRGCAWLCVAVRGCAWLCARGSRAAADGGGCANKNNKIAIVCVYCTVLYSTYCTYYWYCCTLYRYIICSSCK